MIEDIMMFVILQHNILRNIVKIMYIFCLSMKQDEDSAEGDDSNDASDESPDGPPPTGGPPPSRKFSRKHRWAGKVLYITG